MKTRLLLPAVGLGGLLVGCCAMGRTGAQQTAVHAPDGGTRETLESILIPPLPNAPFSAVVTTEWTRIMPDGSKLTMWNHRMVERDSSGRVFQERRYLAPNGNTETTPLSELQYEDPNRQEMTLCRPARQVCTIYRFRRPTAPAMANVGPLPNGRGSISREDLGRKTIENVDVVGTREITTIAAGAIGNEKAQPIVKEFWYSPRLGINVVTKRFDPRVSAIQNFEVGQINLNEPDPKMFAPPANYRMLRADER